MYTNELITTFYDKMKSSFTTKERLVELSNALSIKLYTNMHGRLTSTERSLINDEYQTWALLHNLNEIENFHNELKGNSLLSQIESFLEKDKNFLCTTLLMQWVEKIKRVGVSQLENYSLIPSTIYDSTQTYNQSLDPDSVLKNFSAVYNRGSESVIILMKDVFWLIRSGNLKKAQELLISSDASWQALTIGGLLPYFDFHNYEYSKTDMIPSLMCTLERESSLETLENDKDYNGEMGNCNLELYISTCWALSKKSKIISEKAIYGSLCGNYETMLEMCDGDIYDHFWALIRTFYIFQLRQKIKGIEEKLQPIETLYDKDLGSFGIPLTIPNQWPSSFEGILRLIQQKYSNYFENSFIRLQFHWIAQAVLGKWDGVLENVIILANQAFDDSEEGKLKEISYMRFAAHFCAIFKEDPRFSIEKRKSSEEIIGNYIQILINYTNDLDLILFYVRYLINPSLFRILFKQIFEKFSTEANYKKSVLALQTYAQQDYQGILSQIILEISNFKEAYINPSSVLDTLKAQNLDNRTVKELLKNIYDTVTRDSLPSVLALMRQLIISCKIDLANALFIKCYCSNKTSLQELEIEYWGKFINVCDLYVKFEDLKAVNYMEEIERDSFKTIPSSLITPYKLEQNPVIALEKQKEKCTQIAVRLEPLLIEVVGFRLKEFPLQNINYPEISKFKENWWWILILWFSEILMFLKKYSELEEMLALLESIFLTKIVEDQRSFLVRKIKDSINQIRNNY